MTRTCQPGLSVVMPVYNSARYVAEAIESILKQTFADFEFIIIDDGSKDESLNIIKKYKYTDNRINIIRNEQNQGIAVSLNRGLQEARAPLIVRMDSDDISEPGRLASQVEYMSANPDVMVASGAITFYETGVLYAPPKHDAEIRTDMLFIPSICHSAAVIRRELCLAVGGYRAETVPAEDYDLWLRMGRAFPQKRFMNCKEILIKYRLHLGVDRKAYTAAQYTRHIRLCAEQLQFLGVPQEETDLEAHAALGSLAGSPDVPLRRIAAWANRLIEWNNEKQWYDHAVFSSRVCERLSGCMPQIAWIPSWVKKYVPVNVKAAAKKILLARYFYNK